VNPQNANRALALVQEVLNTYRQKGISTDELKRESGGAAGMFTVSMRSSLGIAKILTRFKALGMGIEGADKHAERILSVKKSQVDEVIEKYLHPNRFLTVLAGTFQ
jgi:zinc protease